MEENRDIAIEITGLKKRYRLGVIGGGTLQGDIQSWWARKRGKEDPNLIIGQKQRSKNETFMALNGVDLTVYKGERLGIIGHNGAGKSTLLKLLSRVTAPTEGSICIDGRISSMLEVGTGFNPELTGRENIYLNGAILGMTKEEVSSKIDEIIEFSECGQFIDTPVKRYSSGMYVKLAFAVAAHLDSEILVMDEVLAVGDMKFQQKCLGKMSDVSQSEGRTVLYVSHNMNTIRQLCNRCIVLNHGKISFDGDVEEAITIYLEEAKQEKKTVVFLENARRTFATHYYRKMSLQSVVFEGKETNDYKDNECIVMTVRWKSEISTLNTNLRVTIYDENSSPVSTVICHDNFLTVEGDNKYTFSLSLEGLVPGDYSANMALYETNEYKTMTEYDSIINAFSFGVQYITEFQWARNIFGSMKSSNMNIVK